jgi:hypothetical protein
VNTPDISLLGAHYGLFGGVVAPYNYLDVGPTTDHSVNGRPVTDNAIEFEDLVVFALNYGRVSLTSPKPAAAENDELLLVIPSNVQAGDMVDVPLFMIGTGLVQGLSVALGWNAQVVEPVGVSAGEMADENGGVVFTPGSGVADAAVLGTSDGGFTGEGRLAVYHFRALASGSPNITITLVRARNAQNGAVDVPFMASSDVDGSFLPKVTELLPPAPNPFNPQVMFRYRLSSNGEIDLAIYSADGRLVRALETGSKGAGEYAVAWDGTDGTGRKVGSGQYFVRLRASGSEFVRRVTLLK